MTVVMRASLKPNRMPAAMPSISARVAPLRRPATTMATTNGTAAMPAATIHSRVGAVSLPLLASPITTIRARATVRTVAQTQSERVMRRPVRRLLRGRANSSTVTISGCTTTRRPTARAAATAMKPPVSAATPPSQRGRRSRMSSIPIEPAWSSRRVDASRCWSAAARANRNDDSRARPTASTVRSG